MRSSQNSSRHGLLAKCVALQNESREGFDATVAEYLARFRPADGVELGIIEEMAAAFWRQRRAWAIETGIIGAAVSSQPGSPVGDELARITAAFSGLAGQPQLDLAHRYETRLHHMFQRALHNLLLLRSEADSGLPSEPSPISEHSEPDPALPQYSPLPAGSSQ